MPKIIVDNIDGIESIRAGFTEYSPRINKAVKGGLNALQGDLTYALQRHIQTDVYAMYKPSSYVRRNSRDGIGTPLESDENIYAGLDGDRTLVFGYFPSGRNTLYDEEDEVEGDELIKVLSYGQGYSWDVSKKNIPPRPFWDNFVTEQIQGGVAEISFVKGMNEADGGTGKDKLNVVADKRIYKTNSDTEF